MNKTSANCYVFDSADENMVKLVREGKSYTKIGDVLCFMAVLWNGRRMLKDERVQSQLRPNCSIRTKFDSVISKKWVMIDASRDLYNRS